jgi:hypothetical protein
MKLIGLGFGFHTGKFNSFSIGPEYNMASDSAISFTKNNIFPSAYFRIGYVDSFFGELKIAQQFPTPFPSLGLQTNLGLGFKNYNGVIRIGTASFAGLFIAPAFPVGNHIIIEPYLAGFSGLIPSNFPPQNFSYQRSSFVGSLSIRLKFGRNEKSLK